CDHARGVCSSAVGQRGSGNRNIAQTRCHLWKRDGRRGRAEAADRHHRSVLTRVLPVPIPAPPVPPTSPRAGAGTFHPKHFSKEVSARSRVRALTCCCRSARVELAGRAIVATVLDGARATGTGACALSRYATYSVETGAVHAPGETIGVNNSCGAA